jgi:hypothetical protein
LASTLPEGRCRAHVPVSGPEKRWVCDMKRNEITPVIAHHCGVLFVFSYHGFRASFARTGSTIASSVASPLCSCKRLHDSANTAGTGSAGIVPCVWSMPCESCCEVSRQRNALRLYQPETISRFVLVAVRRQRPILTGWKHGFSAALR